MIWKTIERPGYFGKMRDKITSQWNKTHGKGNWRIAWQLRDMVLPKSLGLQIYEDSYYEFFNDNPEKLDWIISTASNVYDTAPSNINSGFDYTIQETPNNHIHDIAIRKAIIRSGEWFKGNHLVHVRSTDTEGKILSPMFIPFHLPWLIYQGEIKDYPEKGKWWRKIGIPNSVEEFYQHNKILQVKI